MVKTSPSIAVCTASLSPAVCLLSETPELEKDYYPALLDEALKPREGQGSAYRDRARWMLSSPAALEVHGEGASSGVTLTTFQGDLGPEQRCLGRISVVSRSKLPHTSPAWSTDPGVVVCQLSLPHLQRIGSKQHWVSSLLSALTTDHSPPTSHSPSTSQPREHHLKGIQLSWESQVTEEKGVVHLSEVIKPKAP